MNTRVSSFLGMVCFSVLLLFPVLISGTVITVRQDGTGDFLTITDAITAASAHDTIDVGPGTYAESNDIYIPLIFISANGAATTIIDGLNASHHLWFTSGVGSEVVGFTFINGYNFSGGGSIRAQEGATVTIRDCHFQNNHTEYHAGAVFSRDAGSRIEVYDCVFIGNSGAHNGGAATAILSSQMSLTNCTFQQNSTGLLGGALAAKDASIDVWGCLFHRNTSDDVGGAIYYNQTSGNIESNTFYDNTSPGGASGTVVLDNSGVTNVSQNIFSSDRAGYGLCYYDVSGSHSCNIFWNNANGSIYGGVLDPSELVADPLFCNPPAGDFTIAYASPAAPEYSPCGLLIGAFPAACEIEPPTPSRITVRQDGTGDFLTITDAVAAASAQDTIDVGPGTYAESNEIYYIPLIFISANGAATTIIDGLNASDHLRFTSGVGSEVIGFTFINGFHSSGGGSIRAQGGATVTIRDCYFQDNYSDYHAGAIITLDAGSTIDVYDCVFIGNRGAHNGGAATAILGSQMSFTNCIFQQNSTGLLGGALAANNASMDVRDCLFRENTSDDAGGAIYFFETSGIIESNTFYDNTSPGEVSGTVLLQSGGVTNVSQNIFSSDRAGYGLYYYDVSGSHSCNIFWNNAKGPIYGSALNPSELVADPLFCNPPAGDFTIAYESPAAPEYSPCGLLIGAFPAACEVVEPWAEPTIISILDIPNDQGGRIRIKWEKCYFDAPNSGYVITGYGIYRYQGEFAGGLNAMQVLPHEIVRESSVSLDGWDYLATVPARGDSVYQFIAPTLCDSTRSHGTCWSLFFVSAMTPDPLIFFDSAPDSGYSVDNLPPHVPADLIGVGIIAGATTGLRLSWNTGEDPDISHYEVYKDLTEDFIPGETNYLGSTRNNSFLDEGWTILDQFYYKVAAVDIHDNVSPYAILKPTDIVIGVLVQSYSAYYIGSGIEIIWTLKSYISKSDHHISRAEDLEERFEEINDPVVVRDDLTYTFVDKSVEPGKRYRYRVEIEESGGQRGLLFETESVSTPSLPLTLYQNHPNPFNPTTTIEYYVPAQVHVRVVIYDVSGRQIKNLVDGIREKGFHKTEWNGTDEQGKPVTSGVYFYRLISGKETISRKMVYLK